MMIEGWGAWDAFYMTVITVTTVRLPRSHDLSRAGQRFTVVRPPAAASARRSIPSRCWRPWSWRAACPSGCSGAGTNACSKRSRTTSSSAATAASAASSRSSSAGRACRSSSSSAAPERLQAGDGGRRPRRGGRRQPRGRAQARRHRSRARADRRRRYRRRERLRRAERARDAAGSVHRRPRGDRGCDAEAEARRRGPRDLAVSDWRACRWRRRRCGRPSSTSFELATSSDNLELAMEEIAIAPTSALADQSILERQPAPALRRHRRRHPARRIGGWSSIPSRTRSIRRRRQARGARPARVAEAASRRRPQRDDGARCSTARVVAKQIRAEVARQRSPRSRRAPGGRPGSAIVLVGDDPASEIYVRGKLKSAAEAGLRADLERLPATASLDELLAVVDRLNRSDDPRRHPRAVAAARGDGRRRRAARLRRDRSRRRTSTAFTRSTSAGWCRTARRWWPARRPASSSCSSDRTSRSPARAPSSSAAATSSASRWRSCCCTATRPSRSAILEPSICRGRAQGRHPRGRDRPAGLRDAGVRQAGRDGGRRRHDAGDRSGR